MAQEILITEDQLLINFKDGSLSISISAEELKDALNPTKSEGEDEDKKASGKKSNAKK